MMSSEAYSRDLKQSAVAQIDRMFRSPSDMSWANFTKNYFSSEQESDVVKNLIWIFKKANEETSAIFLQGGWMTRQGSEFHPDKSSNVSLWHPALVNAEEVLAWRNLIMDKQVCQPVNQAFREVYRRREVEADMPGCSHRIGAHFLKQHPFSAVAKSRGWKYSLMGLDDDGDDFGASLDFKEHNLRAQFWVFEVNAEDYFDDEGYWYYITSYVVRFVDGKTKKPVDLSSVPPVIFSEALRDGDLFVNATSIGNDPSWKGRKKSDELRDYFQSYSFGELTEIGKTRKTVLEKILPKLRLAEVSTLQHNFLIIHGKKRTYKIHLGSTKVLMEPGDQYLRIDPGRIKADSKDKVILPFEEDAALPKILNTAFILADDDTLTDPKILRQLNG